MTLKIVQNGAEPGQEKTDPQKEVFDRIAAALGPLLVGIEERQALFILHSLSGIWREAAKDALADLAFALEFPGDEDAEDPAHCIAASRLYTALADSTAQAHDQLLKETRPLVLEPNRPLNLS